MRPASVFVGGLALAMVACAPPAPSVDIAAETEALRDAAARYNAAVEARDASAAAAFYARDSRIMPPEEATLVGPAAFQAFLEEVAAIEGFAVTLEAPEVAVGAGGDIGYTVGPVQVTMPGPDGRPVTLDERDVHVWRKQADGSWKIVLDIWNPPGPPPGSGE